ncbi:hypothetical protein QQ045_027404 [Rhodiola kirilowii]
MREDEIITTDPRSQSAPQSRFAKLKPNLILWGSCISYARRNPKSGCNLQDEDDLRVQWRISSTASVLAPGGVIYGRPMRLTGYTLQ